MGILVNISLQHRGERFNRTFNSTIGTRPVGATEFTNSAESAGNPYHNFGGKGMASVRVEEHWHTMPAENLLNQGMGNFDGFEAFQRNCVKGLCE